MLTIEQLRQDIANKNTELETCSRELKDLTTQNTSQKRLVTRKENQIADLVRQSNLTTAENMRLTSLQRELISDQQELNRRETARERCSQKETSLMFKAGALKMQLQTLERSGAVDYSMSKSSYRGRFGSN